MKILILEDNKYDSDLTKREVLRGINNCEIDIAETLAEAKNNLKNKYDVALLDMKLPDGYGTELLTDLLESNNQMAIIILTGSGDEELAVSALKSGADDYIVKKKGYLDQLNQIILYSVNEKIKITEQTKHIFRVLYLEHHSSDIELTLIHFKRFAPNFQLKIVTGEEELLQLLPKDNSEEFKYHVLMMDYKLPGTNALELTKVIRHKRKLDIPIIIVTGQGNEEIAIQSLRLGVDDYLVKRENYLSRLPSLLTSAYQKRLLEQQNKKLAESEEIFRSIFEDHSAIKLIIEPESGKIISANKAASVYYGWSIEKLTKTSIFDINVLSASDLKVHLNKAINQKELQYEFRHRHADGSISDVITYSSKVNIKGKDYLHTIVYDISKEKKAEKQLQLLNASVEQSPVSIVITGFNGNIEYVNPYFTESTGYSFNELKGKNLRILNSGVDKKDFYKQLWDTILGGDRWYGEICNKKKNGEIFWEHASISPIYNFKGELTNFVKVAEDITESKKSEQIKQVIYNIAKAAILSKDLESLIASIRSELGTIIDTANFFVALYDHNSDSFSYPYYMDEKDKFPLNADGKTLTRYVIETKKPLLAKSKEIEDLINKGKITQVGSMAKVWLGIPLKTNDKITGIFVLQSYTNEVAYSKSDMEMLEFTSAQISMSINLKAAEAKILDALEKATESDKLKTAFLHNISHEIRTPMNGIMGFSTLLKEPDLDSESKDSYIDIIISSGDRMLSTLDDLVDISMLETDQVNVKLVPTDINNELDLLSKFFQPEISKFGLAMSYSSELNLNETMVVTDRDKLYAILTNLIKNAIKYTNEGNITFSCKKRGDFLVFKVSDSGIGIPEHRMSAIFDRFVQADITDVNAYGGSGLGLSISKAYIEMLKGDIGVESAEGKGSTFTFTIPYVQHNKSQADLVFQEKCDSKVVNKKILIAEDESVSEQYLSTILGKNDNVLFYAENGHEAVEIFKKNTDIDIILMDVKMPKLGGYEATKEIRKLSKDVIIIAQTAFARPGDREKAFDAGCNDYITKPYNKSELYEKIESHIR